MPLQRRQIKSGTCYEICFRAKNALPLVAYRVINLIIASVLARAQRDNKVTLCHDLWNGSHPHMIIVAWDSCACVQFYSEVQKKITDALKRLLGINHLNIWQGRPMVAEIADLQKAKERIVYLYANPAQDNLVESVDKFPGFSSWRDYNCCKDKLSAKTTESCAWIRLPSIPKVASPILTSDEDANLVRLLRHRNKRKHLLVRKPNEWMRCFGVTTDEEAAKVNQEILEMLREREHAEARTREKDGKTVMGVARLLSQPILAPHAPSKWSLRVFILTSINELRIRAILERKHFSKRCRECYEAWKRGDFTVEWPPGAFKPPMPPNLNLIPRWVCGFNPA